MSFAFSIKKKTITGVQKNNIRNWICVKTLLSICFTKVSVRARRKDHKRGSEHKKSILASPCLLRRAFYPHLNVPSRRVGVRRQTEGGCTSDQLIFFCRLGRRVYRETKKEKKKEKKKRSLTAWQLCWGLHKPIETKVRRGALGIKRGGTVNLSSCRCDRMTSKTTTVAAAKVVMSSLKWFKRWE